MYICSVISYDLCQVVVVVIIPTGAQKADVVMVNTFSIQCLSSIYYPVIIIWRENPMRVIKVHQNFMFFIVFSLLHIFM